MDHKTFCGSLGQLHHLPPVLVERLDRLSALLLDSERRELFAASKDFNQRFHMSDTDIKSALERVDQFLMSWEKKVQRLERMQKENEDHNHDAVPDL